MQTDEQASPWIDCSRAFGAVEPDLMSQRGRLFIENIERPMRGVERASGIDLRPAIIMMRHSANKSLPIRRRGVETIGIAAPDPGKLRSDGGVLLLGNQPILPAASSTNHLRNVTTTATV